MPARRVAVIGAGYVGLTTAACLASLGHDVVCADVDAGKVDRLAAGVVDLAEPGLADLVAAGTAAGRLRFVLGAAAAVGGAEVVMLCVPTPMGPDGSADLTVVESVVADVRGLLAPGCVLVAKSTVPIGTLGGWPPCSAARTCRSSAIPSSSASAARSPTSCGRTGS